MKWSQEDRIGPGPDRPEMHADEAVETARKMYEDHPFKSLIMSTAEHAEMIDHNNAMLRTVNIQGARILKLERLVSDLRAINEKHRERLRRE